MNDLNDKFGEFHSNFEIDITKNVNSDLIGTDNNLWSVFVNTFIWRDMIIYYVSKFLKNKL